MMWYVLLLLSYSARLYETVSRYLINPLPLSQLSLLHYLLLFLPPPSLNGAHAKAIVHVKPSPLCSPLPPLSPVRCQDGGAS
jgi:hypothetical protein